MCCLLFTGLEMEVIECLVSIADIGVVSGWRIVTSDEQNQCKLP